MSSLRRASVCLLSKRAGRVGANGTDFHIESLPTAGPKFLAQCSGPTKPDSDGRSQFYRKAFVFDDRTEVRHENMKLPNQQC